MPVDLLSSKHALPRPHYGAATLPMNGEQGQLPQPAELLP